MTEQPFPAVPEFDLADRMRKALRHGGITVQDMAVYLGVSRKSVGNWIGGRIEPGTQTLRLWALRCGVDYGWLAGDPGPCGRAALTSARGSRMLGYSVLSPQVMGLAA